MTDSPTDFRCGFAALVGRPNVGKSTLLNALVGQKLSIVTPRPQTTRHRILGLAQLPNAQIAFVDTPGLHSQAKRALNKAMNRTAAAALEEADLVVFVVEALVWNAEDELVLKRIARAGRPALVAVNKVDKARPRERLLPYLADLDGRHDFLALVPVSALKGKNLDDLRSSIAAHLPLSPPLFPDGELTDRGLPFRIAEMIREKLT
ncbi:MAG TPA: GTPase Era, partial [Steroidobacteraceae bacterium]|nr:GTPase Era [Steroidobacteraceae bacterium]